MYSTLQILTSNQQIFQLSDLDTHKNDGHEKNMYVTVRKLFQKLPKPKENAGGETKRAGWGEGPTLA